MNDTTKPDRVAETQARITAAIVEAIEAGIANPADWSLPWHNTATGLPVRIHDSGTYAGGNLLLTWYLMQTGGAGRYWGTYNQWTDAGATIPKGTKAAAYLLRPMTITVEDPDTGEKRTRGNGKFRPFAVFHSGQVEGWTEPIEEQPERPADDERADIDAAFRWAAMTGATIDEHASRGASYSPTLDVVTIPHRERFADAHGAWSTIAHELCHWTGHATRLNRSELGSMKRFGDDTYAAEELVAELGAAFTMGTLGRSTEPRPDHAQYLASWLRVLKADAGHLWNAAGKASKASDYVLERAGIPATLAAV